MTSSRPLRLSGRQASLFVQQAAGPPIALDSFLASCREFGTDRPSHDLGRNPNKEDIRAATMSAMATER
jgi:hypothetical protein